MSKRGRPPKDRATSPEWTYRDWYLKNKEDLSRRRKERYTSDPEYRAKVQARNRNARAAGQRPTVEVAGKTENAMFIGDLANAIKMTIPTIHGLEKSGTLPKTPLVAKCGSRSNRVYTVGMINAVCEVLQARMNQVSSGDLSFKYEVVRRWEAMEISCEE